MAEISNEYFDSIHAKNMEIQINNLLEKACSCGLEQGAFPGVAAAMSVWNDQGRQRGFFYGGKTRNDSSAVGVSHETLFDLASLTKALCTTLCVTHMVDQGGVDWQEPVLKTYFSMRDDERKEHISLQQLLQHTSGFPGYREYYTSFAPVSGQPRIKELLITRILREQLTYEANSLCVYSDLGFILLGAVVEKWAQQNLADFFTERITQPLGCADQVRFLPIGEEQTDDGTRKIAATEDCPWRGRVLQGEVHDEHCWLLGGVSGHAGLFGTAEGVLTMGEMLLDVWKGRVRHPAFSRASLRHILESKHPLGTWCLGFDTPSLGCSTSGRFFSAESVGHLGFSGTSFWIDPVTEMVVVLLTNRIHPRRDNLGIRTFRPFFHDSLRQGWTDR